MAEERLQKILASAGYGSRRACEQLIETGRVRVNGQSPKLGDKADPERDSITLDGKVVKVELLRYVMLNKPRGVVSSLSAQGDRRTVRDLIPHGERLYPVGRLDVDSEGLILMTNDGELANLLTHPRYKQEKEYEIQVDGHPKEEQLESWRRGIVLDGERTRPVKLRAFKKGASGTWLRVTMHEGKKHQIRRTAEALGMWVKKLIRVRIGPLRLGNLKPGEWRELGRAEVESLRKGDARRPRKPPIRRR